MRTERAWTRPLRVVLWLVAKRAMAARRRRLSTAPAACAHLDLIADTFLLGYRAALDRPTAAARVSRLDQVSEAHRGFAYEGAAMALALMDSIVPVEPGRFDELIAHGGGAHVYMAHVGAGWAAARLHRRPGAARGGLDPLLGWLAVDGYGFHQGYFHPERYVRRQAVPRGASGYTARAFDQGLGRSLWFVEGADVERIARTVHAFAPARRADLWSGVALAAAYAGGASAAGLRALGAHAHGYEANLAQAAAFAAEARERAGNPTPHTERACEILAGMSAREAAAIARRLSAGVSDRPERPAYEQWRQRVGAAMANPTPSARRPALNAQPPTSDARLPHANVLLPAQRPTPNGRRPRNRAAL